MNEDEARVVAVRLEIVEYMKENSDFFSPICEAFGQTLDDHLDEMRRNSSWGGYPELLAAEELYNQLSNNEPYVLVHRRSFKYSDGFPINIDSFRKANNREASRNDKSKTVN